MSHQIWKSCALPAFPWMRVAVPRAAAFAVSLNHGAHSQESAVPGQRLRCFWQWGGTAQHCWLRQDCSRVQCQQSRLPARQSRDSKTMKNYTIRVWLVVYSFFISRTEPLGEYQRVDSVLKLLKTAQASVLQNLDRSRRSRLSCVFDGWPSRIRTKQILRILQVLKIFF